MARSKKGLVGTIVFHAGLLAFAIFFGFITPLPLPEEAGILINFGTDDFGFGEEEPMYSEIPEEQSTPPPQEAVIPVESTEEIISQDFEEAPVVTEKPAENITIVTASAWKPSIFRTHRTNRIFPPQCLTGV